jgi:hypothetical protein
VPLAAVAWAAVVTWNAEERASAEPHEQPAEAQEQAPAQTPSTA